MEVIDTAVALDPLEDVDTDQPLVLLNVTLLSESQFANAFFPIDLTPLPIVALDNDEQYRKASSEMEVTLVGIVMLLRDVWLNAATPILVTVLGKYILLIGTQQKAYSPIVVWLLKDTLLIALQFQKAYRGTEATLEGIEIELNRSQLLNALSPNDVNVLGSDIRVILDTENALLPMDWRDFPKVILVNAEVLNADA